MSPIQLAPVITGTTLSDLKDQMAALFDNGSTKFRTRVGYYAEVAYREIMSAYDWSWLHQTSTITTVASVGTYDLEVDVGWITGPMVIGSAAHIERVPIEELRRFEAQSDTSGRPMLYATTGRQSIVFWPYPDAAYTVTYDYKILEARLEDSVTPAIPISDQHIWFTAVEAKLRGADNRFDAATTTAVALYQEGLKKAIMRDASGENLTRINEDWAVETGETL